MPTQVTVRVEFNRFVSGDLDDTRSLDSFPISFQRLQFSVTDRNGKLGVRIIRLERHRTLRIIYRGAAEAQLLLGLCGVAHQVSVLARDSQQKAHILWLKLFPR